MPRIIIFAILGFFSFLGIYIYLLYKKKKRFFQDIISFLNEFKIELGFSKSEISNIINRSCKNYGRYFKQSLAAYDSLLTTKQDITRESLYNIFTSHPHIKLKTDEIELITDFFYNLGKHGSAQELEKTENSRAQIEIMHKLSDENLKSEGKIYLKLCIIAGLVVVIILI